MTKTIKNITSCTHCGDTYSVDDALNLGFDFDVYNCHDEEEAGFVYSGYQEKFIQDLKIGDNSLAYFFSDSWAFDEKNELLYTSEKACVFISEKKECLKCHKQYLPLENFSPVTMDKWIYDMHRGCKGG